MSIFLIFAISGCSNSLNVQKQKMTKEEVNKIISETDNKSRISKEMWKKVLDKKVYDILWNKGTERPFTGELLNEKREGTYVSAGCEIPVFSSEDKFESGSGWPSFTKAVDEGNIILKKDWSLGFPRTEVLSKCGEHLGHVFNDGPKDKGGKRFCINSKALKFVPKS